MTRREQAINPCYDDFEGINGFRKGIRACFDVLKTMACNTDDEEKSAFLHDLADDLLQEVSIDDYNQLKQIKEEIERLNCRVYHAEGYINDLHNHPNDKKFYDAKARRIVAMLFWNYKRNLFAFDVEATVVVESKRIFEKAYKMLKDNA